MLGPQWPNFFDYKYHLLVEQLSEHVTWDYNLYGHGLLVVVFLLELRMIIWSNLRFSTFLRLPKVSLQTSVSACFVEGFLLDLAINKNITQWDEQFYRHKILYHFYNIHEAYLYFFLFSIWQTQTCQKYVHCLFFCMFRSSKRGDLRWMHPSDDLRQVGIALRGHLKFGVGGRHLRLGKDVEKTQTPRKTLKKVLRDVKENYL